MAVPRHLPMDIQTHVHPHYAFPLKSEPWRFITGAELPAHMIPRDICPLSQHSQSFLEMKKPVSRRYMPCLDASPPHVESSCPLTLRALGNASSPAARVRPTRLRCKQETHPRFPIWASVQQITNLQALARVLNLSCVQQHLAAHVASDVPK
jgi:hypothetical protein